MIVDLEVSSWEDLEQNQVISALPCKNLGRLLANMRFLSLLREVGRLANLWFYRMPQMFLHRGSFPVG